MMREIRYLLARWAGRFGREEPSLLLPMQTLVVARHLIPLARLAHGLGIPVCYTLAPKLANTPAGRWVREILTFAHEVGPGRAHAHRWRLIVVADHGHFRTLLPTASPIVHIGHGSPSKTGTRHPQMPWEYGHAPRRRDGSIAYHEMIESSEAVREAMIRLEPALAPRIRVLGRLLDDEMLATAADHTRVRQTLGLGSDRPILLVASTMRTPSLFGSYWDALLTGLEPLARNHEVVLCPHPNEYRLWRERMDDRLPFRVLGAEIPTEQVLAVADVLLTDFSSLCHKAALLQVPMVFARFQPLPVWSEGATARLYLAWPNWDGSEPLEPLVAAARAYHDDNARNEACTWVNSHPGAGDRLYGAWLRHYFPATFASGEVRVHDELPQPDAHNGSASGADRRRV